MPRNLDIGSLRSFLTVAEMGGVTRAAAQLNLTQSAVSLQLKRLEDAFGQPLIERNARGVTLTSQGEQLVGYAKSLLALNDETWVRMTAPSPAGEINLGVPEDLLYPHVPQVMHDFSKVSPRVKVQLHSTLTATLKEQFARGALDLILATEAELEAGGETLMSAPLVWMGAPDGRAWRRRPLPLGTVARCMFTKPAIETLNASGLDWKLEIDSVSTPAIEASIAADMIVHLQMRGTVGAQFEMIPHGGALPTLPVFHINMYVTRGPRGKLAQSLAERFRAAYAGPDALAAE